MSNSKTYLVVGFSKNKRGNTIVRFTNKLQDRIRTLKSHAIEGMKFYPLPKPMTKIEAARQLNTEQSTSLSERLAIAEVISSQLAA